MLSSCQWRRFCLPLVLLSLLAAGPAEPPQHYSAVAQDSEIEFTIRNMGIKVDGSFSTLSADIYFDPEALEASRVRASIGVKSLETGINKRDEHLMEEDYFHASKYPKIEFRSDEITKGSAGLYLARGPLTIKGHTEQIDLPFLFEKEGQRAVFTGRYELNRQTYGVGGDSWTLSDEVNINLRVEARAIE
jgi:polyisoprenoid-binding protein YceI